MIQISDPVQCNGCAACFSICMQKCISMVRDNEGFRYPIVNTSKCTECGLCESVCPLINKTMLNNEPQSYACINLDQKIRLASSSGGIFSLIADIIIDRGGVVIGAAFDSSLNVIHDKADSRSDIARFRGSKYVQSQIGNTLIEARKCLEQGKHVLFTGTPCQIGGLLAYLGKDYTNLLCIDIICHGVPSPLVFEKYIRFREQRAASFAQKIAFRRKDDGWKRYVVSFQFKNGTTYRQPLEKDLFMRAFLKDVCLRPSCHSCAFKTLHRHSDITLADFWGIANILPDMDDDKGTSLVLVNSEKGKEMMRQISSRCKIKEVDINQAIQYNTAAIRSAPTNPNRKQFFRDLENTPFDKLVRKYCTDQFSKRLFNAFRKRMVGALDSLVRLNKKK